MNKLTLKKLYVNENFVINFNEGENYIVGQNGSGKTTVFNLIQFILGIQKNTSRYLDHFSNLDKTFLECLIGDQKIKIKRDIRRNIIIFEGNSFKREARVGSPEMARIYHHFFQNRFAFGEDDKSIVDLIKLSFLDDINLNLNKNSTDSFKKMLGANVSLTYQIKEDINKLRESVEIEKLSLNLIEKYITNIREKVTNHKELDPQSINVIKQLMADELSLMKNETLKNHYLLNEAENALAKIRALNEDYLNNKFESIEPYFKSLASQVGVNVSLRDMLDNKSFLRNYSLGLTITAMLLLHIVLLRHNSEEVHNGTGLIVHDSMITATLDSHSFNKFRDIIAEETNKGSLQYIEFCSDFISVPKNNVVFNLSNVRGALFEGEN